MAIRSSILAWKTPWAEQPGRLQSMELHKVRQDLVTEHILLVHTTLLKYGC